MVKLTQKAAFAAIRALGFTCRKVDGGDYRLARPAPFHGGAYAKERRAKIEAEAYYSSDLEDVLMTAQAWARIRDGGGPAAANRGLSPDEQALECAGAPSIAIAPPSRGGAGIETQTGPYMHMHGTARRRIVKGQTYIVGIAGAYNAFGLIGPEDNGIFILNETGRFVVTDQIAKEVTGYYGPSQRQWDALRAFMTCGENAFIAECMASARYRGRM